jgi:hypothetical protein
MLSKGRLIGIGFGLFALVCLVFTYDYARGRTPRTDSALVAEVLAATTARECGRDATEIASRYLLPGIEQAEAERILGTIGIVPPEPWFWRPAIENSTSWEGDTLEALRTIKATAFGSNLLRLHLTFGDGKLRRLAAEVVCRFD